jgi:hypothetical protein
MQERLLIGGILVCVSLGTAQCGGTGADGGSPSAPSPTSQAPSLAPGSSALTVSPQSIQGQGQPQATVTIASSAPAGGALVALASSNTSVAQVPASVTIPAGQRSAGFTVNTSSVATSATVTLTATYGSSTMSSALTVTTPPVSPSFVVQSPTHGPGTCEVESGAAEFDCVLDGSGSTGPVRSWIWTYTVGTDSLSHTATDAGTKPQIATKCAFLNTGTGGDGPNGDRYLKMQVTLQVEDASGARSGAVSQAVRLYPNRECGFSY